MNPQGRKKITTGNVQPAQGHALSSPANNHDRTVELDGELQSLLLGPAGVGFDGSTSMFSLDVKYIKKWWHQYVCCLTGTAFV